jgi:ATP adenylyltransferase
MRKRIRPFFLLLLWFNDIFLLRNNGENKVANETLGDINRTRTAEQRAAYEQTVGQDKCPFCGEVHELPPEILKGMICEWSFWRAWYSPFAYSGHQTHIILAPIQHWTKLSDITLAAAAEWMHLCTSLIEDLNLPGGGLVMRFGDSAYNGGSLKHLHSHIQVPDRVGFAIAVFYENDALSEFFKQSHT